ncbi:hypothetical protein [Kineococcus glutinatus]|uniref:Heparinase II/III-like protein n=1 Tax=Kineococcus glutinatus TaxID=1070872 RepID=A0ABP9HAJ4_9ACTN
MTEAHVPEQHVPEQHVPERPARGQGVARRAVLAGGTADVGGPHLLTAATAAGAATTGPAAGAGPLAAFAEGVDVPFARRLLAAAEAQVPQVLTDYPTQIAGLWQNRAMARSALRLAAVWVTPFSRHHHDPALAAVVTELVAALRAAQHEDGLFDQGNLHSPPDSAFSANDLAGLLVLLRADADLAPATASATAAARADLEVVLRAVGAAMATGGVHTPNHRWEICGALARIDALLPDPAHRDRIEAWLAEGVDVDADGQYSERSPNYSAAVTNPSLLALARYAGRTALRDVVRRNLRLTLRTTHPDGQVESVQSRRQDQGSRRFLDPFLLQLREMALRDRDGEFAAAVQRILAAEEVAELGDAYAQVLLAPDLAAPLPAPTPLRLPARVLVPGSDLAILRSGTATAVVFAGTDGGGDEDRPGPIGSGLSTNPTFLSFRRGGAVLESVRLQPNFFSTGHFRPRGLGAAPDGSFELRQRITAGYYQPLPARYRRPDGDYALTPEGRFWAAMDFPHRHRDARVLTTRAVVRPVGGDVARGVDVELELDGAEVPVTIELAFRAGGVLTGTQVLDEEAGTSQLVEGWGSYAVGGDVIRFGPGTGAGPRQPVIADGGERYTWLRGSLTPEGVLVYLTTTVPRRWTLSLR